jgi:hypothetical protein
MFDKRNQPIFRTAYAFAAAIVSSTVCPIVAGDCGLWENEGVPTWRYADGSDVVLGAKASTAFFVAIAKTSGALAGAPVYANGTAGVGATLTKGTNGAIGAIGGITPTLGQIVLVDQQVSTFQNGLYFVSDVGVNGGGGRPWVLTRVPGFDAVIVDGAQVAVQQGTFADQIYDQTATVVTIGTDAVAFALAATAVSLAAVQAALATQGAIADPGNGGAIPVTNSGVCNLTSAGAETRTVAIPAFDNEDLTICFDTKVGNIVITVASAFDTTPHTIITMSAAGQYVVLKACRIAGVKAWRLVVNGGTALS